ncbi:MAG: RraA family protein [Gammaproteobacteria bacterium]|nr:RraA family protein [Gammaproteobacteria bacterium]
MSDLELLEELKKIDTPTITNVVATYPGNPHCLSIYNPWTENWYTNNALSCWYPELGPMAGYAVTCTYSLPDPNYKVGPTLMDVLETMDKLGKPSIFCFEQKFPGELADKVGLSGGNMTSAMRACGAIGAISNGPSRDIHEIRPMGFQYLTRGICAGHGAQAIQALQVPVHMSGMDVAPGEIIHMDENGAVKFPANRLEEVVTKAKTLLAEEDERVGRLLNAKGFEEVKSIMSGHDYVKKN